MLDCYKIKVRNIRAELLVRSQWMAIEMKARLGRTSLCPRIRSSDRAFQGEVMSFDFRAALVLTRGLVNAGESGQRRRNLFDVRLASRKSTRLLGETLQINSEHLVVVRCYHGAGPRRTLRHGERTARQVTHLAVYTICGLLFHKAQFVLFLLAFPLITRVPD